MSEAGRPERAALVTGGARGIGLAIAEALAERGDRVTIADLDLDHAARTPRRQSAEGSSQGEWGRVRTCGTFAE